MDNQHRKIKGYRELSMEEIALMNEIKEIGSELQALISKSSAFDWEGVAIDTPKESLIPQLEADRWRNIARNHLQQGLMALTRSVAKPEFF